MVAAAIFKNRPISTKFGIVMFLDPPDLHSKYNFMRLETQHGVQLPSRKSKNHISQYYLHRFQQNFSMLMHNGPP